MINLNPHIDVPKKPECQKAFSRAQDAFPWLKVEHRGRDAHTGRGTLWAGAYDTYELIDPLSPDFGMTGRVAGAAEEIAARVSQAVHGNRDGGKWW